MSNWSSYKQNWEQALDNAEVYDRYARQAILSFMRKINTLQNMMDKMSWSRLQNSEAFDTAYIMAGEIEDNYFDEYNSMLEAAGLFPDYREVNISNLIA